MFAILHALGMFVADLFKSRSQLEAENLLLRHQLTIALRQAPPRLRLRGGDRAFLIWMTRLWPSLAAALYPGRFRSLVVGTVGAAVPLQLVGVLKEWVEAPSLEPYRKIDVRQIVTA